MILYKYYIYYNHNIYTIIIKVKYFFYFFSFSSIMILYFLVRFIQVDKMNDIKSQSRKNEQRLLNPLRTFDGYLRPTNSVAKTFFSHQIKNHRYLQFLLLVALPLLHH